MAAFETTGVMKGVRVLDFTAALAGPYIAWQMADMGAEVWKIERNKSGDQARYWDPTINGMSTLYLAYNKNKQSIEMDLRSEEGKKVVFDMVKNCDIVLENFKSGSIDRMGLGYEAMKAINPKIVFVSLSGFGANGPLMKYPCYDAIAAARSGFAASNGSPEAAPMKAGNANGDTFSGTYALNAALMAMIYARKTGKGCHIDLGMVDISMQSVAETLIDYIEDGDTPSRFGNHDRFTAPYGLFEARDGWAVIIADTEERWAACCDALGMDEIKADPRFADNASRIANRDALVEAMEKITITMKRAEIEQKLLAVGVPASEVLPFIEAYTSNHANATNSSQLINQRNIGMMRFYTNSLSFNNEQCLIHRGAPLLGEDTRSILKDIGYDDAKIEELIANGTVGESLI